MHEPLDTSLLEPEILIGRLIDGEAGPEDRRRFEALAEHQAGLWRTLAQRQLDMGLLTDRVAHELAVADRIELPVAAPASVGGRHTRLMWGGWAAAILVGFTWWISSFSADMPVRTGTPTTGAPPAVMSPDEHLAKYLEAPFVVGEIKDVTLLGPVEPQPDGSKIIRFLRRIVETAVIPPDEAVPAADGYLTKRPDELRSVHPASMPAD
jgi:hypothetical protein